MKKCYFIPAVVLVLCTCASLETGDRRAAADVVTDSRAGSPAAGVVSPETKSPGDEADKTVSNAGGVSAEAGVTTEGKATPEAAGIVRGAELTGPADELEYFVEEPEDDAAASFGTATAATRAGSRSDTLPASSGLSAGFADDNRQYGYFMEFLNEYSTVPHIDLGVGERIMLHVVDGQSKPIANADVRVELAGQEIARGVTMADGTYQFNPSPDTSSAVSYRAIVTAGEKRGDLRFEHDGLRNVIVDLGGTRDTPDPVPLDILFVLDTTGSMGEEIHRLRATIELIHLNLTSMSTKTAVRFGMVLYKDRADEYNTKVVPLTGSLEQFTSSLDLVEASGGGDTPENLQAALESSLHGIDWNDKGIRLGFIITDAAPHLDYDQDFTYARAAAEARERGIKLFSVGTGGLPLSGEYVLRQISQYTGGKYIFLTYNETGESEGGQPGSVSHHTGANYQTDKLEAIIIRFAKEEVSYLTDEPLEEENSYFQAIKIASEEREQTLEKLFLMAMDQLSDYSTFPVKGSAVAAILPIEPATSDLGLNAEYFTEQMALAVGGGGMLTLVDRGNIDNVMNELKLQLSGFTESETVAEVGKLLNAQVLIAGKLYAPDDYELFLRMLRVETGEVLSVTKAVIDRELGL